MLKTGKQIDSLEGNNMPKFLDVPTWYDGYGTLNYGVGVSSSTVTGGGILYGQSQGTSLNTLAPTSTPGLLGVLNYTPRFFSVNSSNDPGFYTLLYHTSNPYAFTWYEADWAIPEFKRITNPGSGQSLEGVMGNACFAMVVPTTGGSFNIGETESGKNLRAALIMRVTEKTIVYSAICFGLNKYPAVLSSLTKNTEAMANTTGHSLYIVRFTPKN